MDDLDIQTAQLIIQLARDDLYQLDDSAFSGNNQDVSDLELALAEQEREFMQHWTEYGGTQIKQNAGGCSGNGSNVGDSAVAGSPIRRAGSPQLRPVTPINSIDDDDDDDYEDMYVNPYEPTSAASSSSSSNPEPASRAAHEPAPAASRSSSSSIGATTSIAGSALPNGDGPHPNSPTLEQLVEQGFALFYLF